MIQRRQRTVPCLLPAKNLWEKIEDWDDIPDIMSILDNFDPSELSKEDLQEFARRNPYETDYYREEYGTPVHPIEHRLRMAESRLSWERDDLDRLNKLFLEAVAGYLQGYEYDTAMSRPYKNVRQQLIKVIGIKAVEYMVRSEYESRSPAEWDTIAREYQEYLAKRREEAESEPDYPVSYWDEMPLASVHEKVAKIRKGLKGSNGRPLTQRDFGKLLGYPVNKYAEAERQDRYSRGEEESPVEYELLEKLVMIAHANPYWLFDPYCNADYAEYDYEDNAVQMGDQPWVYAPLDLILKWIKEGKPRETRWEDGFAETNV